MNQPKCASCHYSQIQSGFNEQYLICTHDLHKGAMLIGEHDCSKWIYEPGTDLKIIEKK
jgi:hypothetical protein